MNYTILLHAEIYETESWDKVDNSPLSFEVEAPSVEAAVRKLQESFVMQTREGVRVGE